MTGAATAAPVASPASRASGRDWRRSAYAAPALSLFGTAVLVLGGTLPVWGTTLQAPQYPKGLSIWFYGGRADGPVGEVNNLNHYIGMRPIDLSVVPEIALWPLLVAGSIAMLLWAIFVPGRLGRLAVLGLFVIPFGVLADIQRWLVIFGSELDRSSALRLDPFVPMVVGPSQVWNFTVWTYPGLGLASFWIAGIIAVVARRATAGSRRLKLAAATVSLAAGIAGTVLLVIPAVMPAAPAGSGTGRPPAGPVDLVRLVDEAPAGATVTVPAGSYVVHLVIDRPLTVVADGEVWLDGSGRGTIVTIRADDVTLRGFHLNGTGGQVEDASAIRTEQASRVTIEGNTLHGFFTGISVNGGEDVRIIDNELIGSGQVTNDGGHLTSADPGTAPAGGTATDGPHAGHGVGAGPSGQGDGISVWAARSVLIQYNGLRDVRDAIYLNYADEVLVDTNTVDRSRYAVHSMFGASLTIFGNTARRNMSGLVFMYSRDVLIGRNTLLDARSVGTGHGIVLKDVTGVRIAENLVSGNRVGLQAEGTVHRYPAEALVVRNRFAANDAGVALMATADLAFAANDFDGNLTQVLALEVGVERHNDWANGGTGNTWSDYAGFDLDADGIGDVPYTAGGAGEILLAADPALAAYRTSPALAVLDAAQAVWESASGPVVVDAFPRLIPVAALERPGQAAQPAGPAGSGTHAGHAGATTVGAAEGPDAAGVPGPDEAAVTMAWRVLGGALIVVAVLFAAMLRGDLTAARRLVNARPATAR